MTDNNNINLNEELEFNNGFGDALREKESYTFSWKKTSVVLGVGLMATLLLTFGILEAGKNALNLNDDKTIESLWDANNSLSNEDAFTEDYESNWDVLPEDDGVKLKEEISINNKIAQSDITPSKPEKKRIIIQERPPIAVRKVSTNKLTSTKRLAADTQQLARTISTPPVVKTKKSIYRVIAGSFSNYNNAQRELEKIKSKGYDGYIWSLESKDKKISYKVQVGAFKSPKTAQKLKAELNTKNIHSFISKH